VVHSLAHAVAVLQAVVEVGRPVLLLSAAGAGLSVGAGWWRETIVAARIAVPEARAASLLDCGDDAGAAQNALRAGVEAIVFTGAAEAAGRLADIARQRGSRLISERPAVAFDLIDNFFAPPETLRRRVLAVLREASAEAADRASPSLREMTVPREKPHGNNAGTE
jgi:hypothetical protein